MSPPSKIHRVQMRRNDMLITACGRVVPVDQTIGLSNGTKATCGQCNRKIGSSMFKEKVRLLELAIDA